MSSSMTLNVRVNGPLGQFVAANVGDSGTYENVSEYVRDLIRKDKERVEAVIFDRLKAELGSAFAAPDNTYGTLTANELIARNQASLAT
jgi:antitoxin ParD1/3/4